MTSLASLQVDVGWLLAALLISVRIASAVAFVPVFGPMQIPAPAKVFLTLALSVLLVSVVPVSAYVDIRASTLASLAVAVLCEVAIGASFALGFLVAYAATQIAGRALDIQVGFGAAGILNPAAPGLSPLIGSLYGMVFVAVFMAMDGHHLLFKLLSMSLVTSPPGSWHSTDTELVLLQSGTMFSFALALAAPVMFALWLSDLAMAIFARSMPQLNVFVLSFAVKILLGLAGLALSIGLTRALFDDLLGSTFRYWQRLAN